MKKILLTFTIICIGLSAYLQTEITINFGITQNGSQLILDSVLIENETIGCDTMIYNGEAGFDVDVISSIHANQVDANRLSVKQNYPNPCTGETIIEAWIPGQETEITVYDISGKLILNKSFRTGKGYQVFALTPGDSGNYRVSFKSKGQEAGITITSSSNERTVTKLVWNGETDFPQVKSTKSVAFIYNQGDVLTFTGYVTACHNVESTFLSASPVESQTYNFDFTYITDIQPDAPVAGEITTTQTSVVWSWLPVENASGYKAHNENDFESATDIETYTSLTFNTVPAGTHFDLFVWAYNECGESFPLLMDTCTQAMPLTQDEIDLILGGASTADMELMMICAQPDSIVLRTLSTNVIIGDENLQHLTDRMKQTVLGEGVGIAAPQVGINRNIIWVQRYDKGAVIHPWELYFNPRIVNYSDTVALRSDGCLSVDTCATQYGIAGNSYRAKWIDVEYYLEDGTYIFERINHQYTAHIFQHEIDHLNGIMYFDRQVEEVPEKFIIIQGDSYEGLPKID
ncbi:MAG: peptide deformylase [Bacteroidales bacterium]|nr:peptide deformylase [Bacteroidales bacterium]